MGRPSRSDRLASAKGRPKRRAAAKTHFFKYQLAVNPDRVEENDLKRALQESLEDQKTTPDKKSTTNNSRNTSNSSKRLVVNSSTNSSDVSKTSYSSNSTTTNDSCGSSSATGSVKRTRSSTLSAASNGTPPSTKRARNDLKRNNDQSSKRKNECDIHQSVLPGSPATLPQLTKAIKTYSRSQLNINGHQQQPDTSKLSGPRSSTPVTSKNFKSGDIRMNGSGYLDEPNGSQQIYASKSTQTTPPQVGADNKSSSKHKGSDNHKSSLSNGVTDIPKSMSTNEPQQPVQNQYLKFKRESKNYAYAKMTALRVNTTKSPCSYSRSSNTKKSSPNSVLNNTSNNKGSTPRTSPRGSTNSNQHKQLTTIGTRCNLNKPRDDSSTPKTPSPSQSTRATPQSKDNINDTDKHSKHNSQVVREANIPKYSLQLISIASNDCTPQDTDDLSKFSNQNQANLSMTKRRMPQGSWSLIGVPEEKVLYLRDDEPARRLICYPAIKHIEGDVIQVRDSVLLRSGAKKTDLPYIAKVCAFWEDAETGGVMMSLLWYYRPEHTEEGRRPHHLPDEIFASRHRDVDTVECIEDKCYVLTFNEYCRYKKRCKMEQVNTTWSLADVTIPVSNESYPRRNRIPDVDVNPELVFCCRQIYDIRLKRSHKNPHINSKYGHI